MRRPFFSEEPLGDWFRREVLPRLTLELVYGADVKWGRAGAWKTRACPLHNGTDLNFHVHPENLGWKCWSQCQAEGDVIAFVQRAQGLDFVGAVRHLAGLVGENLPDGRQRTEVRRKSPVAARTTARPERIFKRPPLAEVSGLWESARRVTADAEACAYLRSRALDPSMLEDRDLVRVIEQGSGLPGWARHAGRSWAESDHRFLLPLFGVTGRMEAVRARLVRPPHSAEEKKALACGGAQVGGLVMADPLARRMLSGDEAANELVAAAGLWVVEGEPDFWTLATAWGDGSEDAPAVLGIVSGSWTAQLAARVPDGTRVVLAVDHDDAGEKYAREIVRTFAARGRAGRIWLRRWRVTR